MTAGREQSFDTEADYAAAIDAVLIATQQSVCVFDNDLVGMGLEQPARCTTLGQILSAHPEGRLRMVLHDPQPLERGMPRLLKLLQRHSDRMEVRQSPLQLRHLSDCFLLGDVGHGVLRFHARHARGKYLLDDVDALQPWHQRFAELWEAATPCLGATRLGL
jgi:hypothetical protein